MGRGTINRHPRQASVVGEELERGRGTERPSDIPSPGWRDILLRTKDSIGEDNVGLVAAGMAFYWLLALFPAIAALVSVWGLFADPASVQDQLAAVSGIVPEEVRTIVAEQMSRVAESSSGSLGLAAGGSILLALWGATKGVRVFMTAMNIAYGEEEKRGFLRVNLLAFGLTVLAILLALIAIVTVIALPAVIDSLGLGSTLNWAITLARWPLVALLFVLALAVFYRVTPSRRAARWQWVSPGSVAAVVVWLVASILFSIYLRNFGNYNATYGSLGAVAALMIWLWLSAYVVVLGAEMNAETERQTRCDSTVGSSKPLGARGAYAADTVGGRR